MDRERSLPDEYLEKGWCLIPQAYSAGFRRSAMEWLRQAEEQAWRNPGLEAQLEKEAPDGLPAARKVRRLLWNDPGFWVPNLADSGIFELGCSFLSSQVAIIFHAAFLKPHRVGSPVGLHQDQALWEHPYPGAISLWIALTDSTPENGCLEVYSGSHLQGLVHHGNDTDHPWHPTVNRHLPALEGRLPELISMAAGDVLVWHRYLLHGSGANHSEHDRVGMVMVFADAGREDFQAKDVYHLG